MNWQINFEGESTANLTVELTGENLEATLIEGIELGLEELEYLQLAGRYCDGCGQWRLTRSVECGESTPTDRGTEWRLLPYELCAECQRDVA